MPNIVPLRPPLQGSYLDRLPAEIREIIGQKCLQADAFRLSLTCKALFQTTHARLYRYIVFDPKYEHVNKEFHKTNLHGVSLTLVRTLSGLRSLIRTLSSDSTKLDLVYRFECHYMSDLPDLHLHKKAQELITKMENLDTLVWKKSPQLSRRVFDNLHQSSSLERLCLDMKRSDMYLEVFPHLEFPQLRELCLQPHSRIEFLTQLGQFIVNCPLLESLYIAGYDPDIHPRSYWEMLNGEHNQSLESLIEPIAIQNRQLKARRFGIKYASVQWTDAIAMSRAIDLSCLTHLVLDGIEEHAETIISTSSSSPQLFLLKLCGRLTNVHHLELDWHPSNANSVDAIGLYESVATFIRDFGGSLSSLRIKIWTESSMPLGFSSSYYLKIIYAILTHARTLEKLTIETAETQLRESREGLSESCLSQLIQGCTNLVSLKVQCKSMLNCIGGSGCKKPLPKIKYLDLETDGGIFFLGQTNFYEMADGLRYRHVVNELLKWQPSLQFIKLESYIFDVRSLKHIHVLPNGLEKWFDSQVQENWYA